MSSSHKPKLRRVLANNVRNERIRQNWTQEQLAERAGLSQTYVSQLESAIRSVTVDVIEKLASALGLDGDELLKRRS